MFNAKSTIVKYVGYGVIGLFILIIGFAFVLPDFMANQSGQPGQFAATVNGENISRIEFARFRDDRMRNMDTSKMKPKIYEMYSSMILSQYIQQVLIKQMGQDMGIKITDDKRDDLIMGIKAFQNPQTNKFDYEIFMSAIRRRHYSETEFKEYITNYMIQQDVAYYISAGLAIPSDELKDEYRMNESSFQVQYAFLSRKNLKKIFKNQITVSEAEVKAEMKKKTADIKNPKTDKIRIKRKLERKKLNDIKRQIVKNINTIAKNGGSFYTAAAQLKGAVISKTKEFKPGSPVKDINDGVKTKRGKKVNLYALYNSSVFRDGCLKLKKGTTSKAINSASGIYIFTPIKATIFKGKIDEKKLAKLEKSMLNEQFRNIEQSIVKKLFEESKIIRPKKKK